MSTVTLAPDARPAFVQRFDALRVRSRLFRLAAVTATAVAALLLGLLVLAAADHAFELPRAARAAGLAVVTATVLGLAAARAIRIWRRTAPIRTAAAVEDRFPELGQSVRTLVQFEDVPHAARLGAAPSLAAALADDTARRAGPLPLESVVPVRALAVTGTAAGGLLVLVGGLSAGSWEWETALRRSLLEERPWTVLTVSPGEATVKEGESLPLGIALEGRTGRAVALFWRTDGETSWAEQPLSSEDRSESGPRLARYEAALPRIGDPVEYRVTAGDFSAGPFAVDVRRPLTIESVAVELTPPDYTGLASRTEGTGDLTAIEGSRGRFRIELDRAPAKAEMIMSPLREAGAAGPRPVPLAIEGKTLVAELDLTDPFDWSVRATAADGMSVRENGWRVRIRRDAPPQVWFERPEESLEVHTLAEILMTVRARDDFGLARAGIAFQINNEQEHTLLLEEFTPAAEDGRSAPRTRADLERKLPLEFFELTEKDSVTYYAFAADNRPDAPHRAETDRRFLDIRPFKRVYRYADSEGMPDTSAGGGLMTLGEIIRRERFVLNRTLRAQKQSAAGEAFDFGVVDRLAAIQAELAGATRRLAELFVAREIDGADLMFQAELAMLAAADSLTAGKFDTASLQERDALRSLIEARTTLELFLMKNPQAREALAEADRRMMQKLRRDEDDKPRRIAGELRRLAREEGEIARSLTMAGRGEGAGQPTDDAAAGATAKAPDDAEKPHAPSEGEGEETDEPGETGGPAAQPTDTGEEDEPRTPQKLEDRQAEIVRRAAQVEAMMRDEKALTDLARARMQAATQAADRAAGELDRGDTGAAAGSAEEAAESFSELARHVEGLLAGEPARRIAEARDLAEEMADRERRLADDLAGNPEGAGRRDGEPAEGEEGADASTESPAEEAERIARSGETLLDLLRSVTDGEDPAAAETASRLAQALAEEKVAESVEDAKRVAARIGAGEPARARTEAAGLADRLAATSRRLDRLYRSIVAPKIDQLARLEARAALLRERLEAVENRADATDWTRDAEGLLDELAEVPELDSDEGLREVLAGGGWRPDERGRLVAPVPFRNGVKTVVEDLQARIQDLLLADVLADGDAAVPSAYRELVDRYYQVLSSSARKGADE